MSPTLAINEETDRRRSAGLATLPLGFGEARLPVLPELAERLKQASTRAGYGPVAGIAELRAAAAGYWGRRGLPTDPDLVVAGPGSKSLLFALLLSVDGTIALPTPCWVSYGAQAALCGRPVCRVPIRPGHGGVPDPALLDAAAYRARAAGEPLGAVVVTLPDNPTGTLADPATVVALCEVADRHDLLVISDEIYRDLVHDPAVPFVSPAELLPARTVVTSGLSKNLAVGGWRIGVARLPAGPAGELLCGEVVGTASEIWSGAAQPVQHAAAWAFTEPAVVRHRIAASRHLHRAVARAVSQLLAAADVAHARPAGAFYLYPDFTAHRRVLADRWSVRTGQDLARVLLTELGVAALPAAAFGEADSRLAVRLATSQLYGNDDEQRLASLRHQDPPALPWVAGQLDTLAAALAALTGAVAGPPAARPPAD